jgi:hypothetical protein
MSALHAYLSYAHYFMIPLFPFLFDEDSHDICHYIQLALEILLFPTLESLQAIKSGN